MDKEVKAMKYAIEPMMKIVRDRMVNGSGTQKKAAALEGTWIRLNENEFALEEADKATRIYIAENMVGCACGRCNDGILCEHILAFEALKSPPQLSIKSPECNWLSGYLMSAYNWVSRDGYLYPPESEEAEPKMIERKCAHCGFVSKGYDRGEVVQRIAEHRKTCPKNPANKKKSPRLVTQTVPEEVGKPSKMCTHPDGTEFNTAEELFDYVDMLKEEQDMNDTKALVATDTGTDADQSWTDSQLEVMRKTVAANATPEEFAYFLNVAKYSGLNPFLKEIYFVKNEKGQTTSITGRDGYLTIAKRDLRFEGVQSMEVCETDVFTMSMCMDDDGAIHQNMTHQITNFNDRGEIIGAWARSQMQGEEPVIVYASMAEYDKSKNQLGGKVWKQYPSSMIRKVAESMVLKRIAGISGLVTEAEIGGTDLVTLDGGE